MRVTIDTPAGSEASVDLDQLALATRLISRDLDHHDPIPGKYTLEVTSPGVERTLRTPAHFQREIGKVISVRLANVEAEQRRFQGELVAADDTTATLRVDLDGELVDRTVELGDIDRARTVFEWGPQPKPGGKGATTKKTGKKAAKKSAASSKQPGSKQTSSKQTSAKQQSSKKEST
jgi:ribosome maturation factor RimP